jgi:hypothetical protein
VRATEVVISFFASTAQSSSQTRVVKSVPRMPMVAVPVLSWKAVGRRWPSRPVSVRSPPFSSRRIVLSSCGAACANF